MEKNRRREIARASGAGSATGSGSTSGAGSTWGATSGPAQAPGTPRRTAADRRHSPSRELLLREIEARRDASTAELVAASGLHENTVRGHLERLLADGHIRAELQAPTGRGRPARRWLALEPEATNPYAGLATVLAETLATGTPDASARAREAGVAWGARLAEGRRTIAGPRALAVEIMREQGFAPDGEGDEVHLRHCPMLAAATDRPEVVCAVHEGMLEGIARAGGSDARAALEPFATPSSCVLRLRTAS